MAIPTTNKFHKIVKLDCMWPFVLLGTIINNAKNKSLLFTIDKMKCSRK